MEVRFIFKSASGKQRRLSRPLPVVIGRSSKADLKIPGEKDAVSRRHCELLSDGEEGIVIRDFGSTNGTFLNGRRLEPEVLVPVKSGATIKLGDVSFRIEFTAAGGLEPTRSDQPAGVVAAADDHEPTEAAAPTLPATEPLVAAPDLEPLAADDESLPVAELEADEPAEIGDFGFLAAAEAAAEGGWPTDGEETAAQADENLDDFFKGLS